VPEAPGTSSEAMQNMALLSGIAELNGDSKAVPLAELYKKLPMSFTTMAKSLASLQSGKFIEVETAGTEESVKLTEAGKTIASFARSK
jgi:RIO-like serine/threonine protein kinase